MKNLKLWKRIIAITCLTVLSMSMVGCGLDNTTKDSKDPAQSEEQELDGFVYVPEIIDLELEEGTYLGDAKIIGDFLYYDSHEWDETSGVSTAYLCRHDMTTGEIQKTPMIFDAGEGMNAYMGRYTVDAEGNVYTVWNAYPVYVEGQEYNENSQKYFLTKYDAEGNQVYMQDISETMKADDMNAYIQYMEVGKDGKVYASADTIVRIFGEDGTYIGEVKGSGNWIMGLTVSKEGRVFFSQHSTQGNGVEMVEILADTKSLGDTFQNVPDAGNGKAVAGVNEDLIIGGYNELYAYDFADQTSTPILTWTGCNVIGSNVRCVAAAEDGSYVAICEDYSTNTTEIVRLVEKPRSEVPQKTQIILGTFNSSQDLQTAVVHFNKRNAEYQIAIEEYTIEYQDNWTPEDYEAAVAQFNTSLVGDNAPDIIDISYNVDVGNLVSKGALEDLSVYLDNSETVSREDFVEGILNAHTIGGKLITIPETVTINTLLGRTEQVGEESGWTVQEIIAFAEKYPDSEILEYATKSSILQTMLQYSFDLFVDYENAACSFNTQEFKDVLAFANTFPAENKYDENEPSMPRRIQSGAILLSEANVHNTQAYQMYTQMFEVDVTNIGYPTFDGSLGAYMHGDGMYAIFSNSENKEGAWQFLESVLAYDEPEEWGIHGFPSRKDELQEVFEADMTPEYLLDENGEKMLDENGEPLQHPKTSWGYDDWNTDIFAASQEQVDDITEMLNSAKSNLTLDATLFSMIAEEAESYFSGQKSVDEVADIIQSRAGMYVSENY